MDEIKMIPGDDKQSLMKELNFSVYVSEEQNLAMKADLGLPWWKIASEKKQRERMNNDLQNIQMAIPFSFTTKRGGQEIRLAPLACVTDLISVIFHLLDERER